MGRNGGSATIDSSARAKPTPLLANVILFQLGWFACVLGAANGLAWAGSFTALILVALHLLFARQAGRETWLLISVMALGVLWDSLIPAAGLFVLADPLLRILAPHWMAALWLVFATTRNVSLRWLRGRVVLATLLGAIGGPLAYYAGSELGALHLPLPMTGLIAQSIGWALLLPLMVRPGVRFDGVAPRRFGEPAHV